MKEINLQDLLNLADASAHDGICDFWNQKTIHYLVVFTSSQEDFEIIGAGPTLPCATLEDAERHVIPGKKPEYYVKCPAAVVKRLQPKLAPSLHQPTPSLKGRTSVPFAASEAKSSESPASVVVPTPPRPKIQTPEPEPPAGVLKPSLGAQQATTPFSSTTPSIVDSSPEISAIDLAARERALTEREQSLNAREASLNQLAANLKAREAAIAATENRLLEQPTLHDEKSAAAL